MIEVIDMKNSKQHSTNSQQLNLKKLLELQPLNLSQLDGIVGGLRGAQKRIKN